MRARNHRTSVRHAHSSASPGKSHRWLNIPMMVLLVLSILSNFQFTPTVSAQQQDNTPPPFPAPASVSVIGNFQAALGCP
ncbi:MAG TPA: hypothetical protein PK691_03475, partial [Thermomicrobiales bacterium]|nr:hypothetical protein [Thermomicrobiales bacterium]